MSQSSPKSSRTLSPSHRSLPRVATICTVSSQESNGDGYRITYVHAVCCPPHLPARRRTDAVGGQSYLHICDETATLSGARASEKQCVKTPMMGSKETLEIKKKTKRAGKQKGPIMSASSFASLAEALLRPMSARDCIKQPAYMDCVPVRRKSAGNREECETGQSEEFAVNCKAALKLSQTTSSH